MRVPNKVLKEWFLFTTKLLNTITLLKIIVTLIVLFLVAKIHALLVLFIPSILCFILTIYDKPILLELEKKSSVGTLSASN